MGVSRGGGMGRYGELLFNGDRAWVSQDGTSFGVTDGGDICKTLSIFNTTDLYT